MQIIPLNERWSYYPVGRVDEPAQPTLDDKRDEVSPAALYPTPPIMIGRLVPRSTDIWNEE